MSSFHTANHWANDSVGCTFKNSAYYVTSTQYVYTCGEYVQDFTNFAFTSQVQLLPGTTGELVFRADSTFKNMYGIAINASNDSYAFRVYTDGQGSILKLGHSPVIAQNTNGFYQFDVVANGNTLAFYLNHQKIDSVTDGTYARGLAGFQIAGNGAGDGNTGMVVKNVEIWRL
jgi:hypothetical protein